MSWPIVTLAIHDETDVVLVRQRTRRIAAGLGFDVQDQTRITTAVSELARNALEHAGGGRIELRLHGSVPPQSLEFIITDAGGGISQLAEVLDGRRPSERGLGIGLRGARRLMDGFEIDSTPAGTTIRMSKLLPSREAAIAPTALPTIVAALQHEAPNPIEELRQQNRELLLSLDALKARQDELGRVNQELEDTNRGVVALYAELDEKADHLRRADELKTRFLSNMSHEFRTPLNSMLALSRMLLERLDGDLTPEQERQVRYIRTAAETLSELVNDLLDLAKVEAGKVEVTVSAFSIDDLFGALRGMLKPLLLSDSVTLVFESAATQPPLLTDEPKLSQILRNFLSNAIKFTERGEIRIWASTSAEGDSVTFHVRDTGIGIAPADQERIFDEFAQIDGPVQRRVKGTGLGLPLSKRLAALLHGRIDITSAPGVGSTFSLTIPRSCPGTVPCDVRWRLDPSRLPVLVIDDDPAAHAPVERQLAGSRYQVVTVHSTAEARDAIATLRPRAVLLAAQLEGQPSWPLLAEIKRNWSTRSIPVLVVGAADEARRAIGMGADDFVLEPLERATLPDRLDRVTGIDAGARVLVIDDDMLARYLMRRSLTDTDFIVSEAASGAEGIRRAREERPDLICLDIIMPDLDGYAVMEGLAQSPETRDIPVLIVTSSEVTPEQRRRLSRAVDVIPKSSVSRERLLAAAARARPPAGQAGARGSP